MLVVFAYSFFPRVPVNIAWRTTLLDYSMALRMQVRFAAL
jgi:hypothetical protein